LWIGGSGGLTIGSSNLVSGILLSAGPLSVNQFNVGNDAIVDGNVTGSLTVGGVLHIQPGATVDNRVTAAGGIASDAPLVGEPCDCDPTHLVDIAGLVAAHAAQNDDARVPLDPAALDLPNGSPTIDLPCGQYYFSTIDVQSGAAIAVHGRVAVYVGGDVSLGINVSVALDPGAELDLFVAGSVTAPQLPLGPQDRPSALRIYVAGPTVTITASSTVAGFVYAPNANLVAQGQLTVYGGLFVGEYVSSAATTVHYDTSIGVAGAACGATGETGFADAMCSSNGDCARTQACRSGVCATCTADGQCGMGQVCAAGSCE
jgi:hypothetical protein